MVLLIVLYFAKLCSCTDLTGSEQHPFHLENYRNAEEHTPLPPYMVNPHYLTGINFPHVLPQKETVTVTKTIVLETTKHVHSHQVCVKAYPGTPPCHPNAKIQATPVFNTPIHQATNMIGFLEKNGEVELPHQVDERHFLQWNHFGHAIGAAKDFFRKTKTITETLWITKVEQYIDNMVTATLIAENCVPISDEIPRCPMKVEHYVHHSKSGPEHIPIFEKDFPENRMDTNEEKDKNLSLETSKSES